MAKADKAAAVAELTESFRSSSAALLTEYRGLTVAELKTLRRSLAGNATYSVVKNTLTRIAARDAGLDQIVDLLQGPSAIAFVSGDPVEAAKSLREFMREHPMLLVKGGVLDGKSLTADEIRRIADLESREVLLAKLAGDLEASLRQAVSLFAAPMAQAARLMAALQAKAEQDPTILQGGDGASAEAPSAAPASSEPASPEPATQEPEASEPVAPDAAISETAISETTSADPTSADPTSSDDGEQVQAVAVDVPPSTDVTGDATSAS